MTPWMNKECLSFGPTLGAHPRHPRIRPEWNDSMRKLSIVICYVEDSIQIHANDTSDAYVTLKTFPFFLITLFCNHGIFF
jgi:hypothetical protein